MVSPSRAEAWKSRGRGCWETQGGPRRQTPSSVPHFFPTHLPPINFPPSLSQLIPSSPASEGKLLGLAGQPTEPSTPWQLGLFCTPPPQRGLGMCMYITCNCPYQHRQIPAPHTCVLGLKGQRLQESIDGGSGRGGNLSGWCGGRNRASDCLAKNSFLQTKDGKKQLAFSQFIYRD